LLPLAHVVEKGFDVLKNDIDRDEADVSPPQLAFGWFKEIRRPPSKDITGSLRLKRHQHRLGLGV